MNQTIEQQRTIIASRCPSCGKYNCFHGIANKIVICINCGEKYLPKPMIKARYSCPNCGKKASLMAEDDLAYLKCALCRSPIDVTYNPHKNELSSLNYWKLCKKK